MSSNSSISFSQQFNILIDFVRGSDGLPYTANQIANSTGISQQTILNFISGRSQNPRLDNLLALCQFFEISVGYFDCTTEDECYSYLRKHTLKAASATIREIASEAENLPTDTQQHILSMMNWIEAGAQQTK